MVKKTTRQYEMLMRVQEFGTTHQPLFAAGSLGAQSLTELSEIVAEITNQEVARRGAVGEGRFTRVQGRKSLARTLNKIRQTSRLLAVEHPLTGESFPRWKGMRSDRALLQTARSYAADAAPLADRFIAHGMPATFMADLQAEIDAFASALDRREQGRATTGEAHSRIRAAIRRGQLAARRLDAYLANTLEHDDPLLAAWKGIRRVGPESRKSDTGTPTTTTTPVKSTEAQGSSDAAAPMPNEVKGKEEAA